MQVKRLTVGALGETWDDVELCERFVLGSTSNREPFSPHKKPWGEKGSRRREWQALEGTIQVSV